MLWSMFLVQPGISERKEAARQVAAARILADTSNDEESNE